MSGQHEEVPDQLVRVPRDVEERENEAAARGKGREVQVLEDVDDRETRRDNVSAEDQADLASTDAHTQRDAAEASADHDAEPPAVPDAEMDIASADSMEGSDPPSLTRTTSDAGKKKQSQ